MYFRPLTQLGHCFIKNPSFQCPLSLDFPWLKRTRVSPWVNEWRLSFRISLFSMPVFNNSKQNKNNTKGISREWDFLRNLVLGLSYLAVPSVAVCCMDFTSLCLLERGCSAFSECQNISVFAKIEVGFCFILFLACWWGWHLASSSLSSYWSPHRCVPVCFPLDEDLKLIVHLSGLYAVQDAALTSLDWCCMASYSSFWRYPFCGLWVWFSLPD